MPAPKLTKNEIAVLRACYASEYANGEAHPGPWSWSVTEHSGLAKRSVAGVVASLVKKGLISSTGTGRKDDDHYVQVLDDGFDVALSLGIIVEKRNAEGRTYYAPADETPAPTTCTEFSAHSLRPNECRFCARAESEHETTERAPTPEPEQPKHSKNEGKRFRRARRVAIKRYLDACMLVHFIDGAPITDGDLAQTASDAYIAADTELAKFDGYTTRGA